MTTPTKLQDLWREIARPVAGRLNGRRVPGLGGAAVWVARDSNDVWHLLVEMPSAAEPVVSRPTNGLDVGTDEMQIADEPPARYADLSCVDPALLDTFATVAADVVNAVSDVPSAPRDAVIGTLARWRRFWTGQREALSQEEALGLFGELWFLERWIGVPLGVRRWVGPTGARHDFQWVAASVEVKASRTTSDGPSLHRISSLDQLADAEVGKLYLFSLQALPDQLAANTLPSLVERLQQALTPYPDEHAMFLERLREAGFSLEQAGLYDQRWRITAEELYTVEAEFPRLTRKTFDGGLPVGVEDVSYSLALTACEAWRIAVRPTDASAAFLRT